MTTFTPGPLLVERAKEVGQFVSFWISKEEEKRLVAVVPILGNEAKAFADATLFAASPRLYEALIAFMDHYRPDEENGPTHKQRDCWALARAALSQARGEG